MTPRRKNLSADESGQTLVELAVSTILLMTLVFGVIDVSRAIYYLQVMKNLTSEGSSLSSRGTTLAQAAQTVLTDAGTNMNLTTRGCVITSAVFNNGNPSHNLNLTGQAFQGSCSGISSRIGCFPPPSSCGAASLPAEAVAALQANQSLFITEIYYTYAPVTPIGNLLNNINFLPAQLYDAAYY